MDPDLEMELIWSSKTRLTKTTTVMQTSAHHIHIPDMSTRIVIHTNIFLEMIRATDSELYNGKCLRYFSKSDKL